MPKPPATLTLRPQRDEQGHFLPGQSGNPYGSPGDPQKREVKALAKQHSTTAIRALVAIADDPKAHPSARVQAATALLDRAFGRPEIEIHGSLTAVAHMSDKEIEQRIAHLLAAAALAHPPLLIGSAEPDNDPDDELDPTPPT